VQEWYDYLRLPDHPFDAQRLLSSRSHPVQQRVTELAGLLGPLYYESMSARRYEEANELRYLLVMTQGAVYTARTDDGLWPVLRAQVLASPQADRILQQPGARELLEAGE
jgi:hypothetical protein